MPATSRTQRLRCDCVVRVLPISIPMCSTASSMTIVSVSLTTATLPTPMHRQTTMRNIRGYQVEAPIPTHGCQRRHGAATSSIITTLLLTFLPSARTTPAQARWCCGMPTQPTYLLRTSMSSRQQQPIAHTLATTSMAASSWQKLRRLTLTTSSSTARVRR